MQYVCGYGWSDGVLAVAWATPVQLKTMDKIQLSHGWSVMSRNGPGRALRIVLMKNMAISQEKVIYIHGDDRSSYYCIIIKIYLMSWWSKFIILVIPTLSMYKLVKINVLLITTVEDWNYWVFLEGIKQRKRLLFLLTQCNFFSFKTRQKYLFFLYFFFLLKHP